MILYIYEKESAKYRFLYCRGKGNRGNDTIIYIEDIE
jgi:hypothetical protein